MKIISGILVLVTTFLSLKHGWDGLHVAPGSEQARMAASLGVGSTGMVIMSILSMVVGVAVLLPQTFVAANLVHAVTLVLIMGLALRAGNLNMALIEIPFLMIPLVLLYLGHPFKK